MTMYGFARGLAKPFVKLIYRYRLEGAENIPEGEFVLCANHVSMADPICIACAFKRKIRFMTKSELKGGIVGKFLKSIRVIFVNREQADLGAIRQCVEALKSGDCVGIFPQGTRVRGKALPSQSMDGVSMICALGKAVALPVALIYIRNKKGKPKLFRKSRIVVGKPISIAEFSSAGDRAAQSEYIFGKVCELIDND